jgi:hypothetical protein
MANMACAVGKAGREEPLIRCQEFRNLASWAHWGSLRSELSWEGPVGSGTPVFDTVRRIWVEFTGWYVKHPLLILTLWAVSRVLRR